MESEHSLMVRWLIMWLNVGLCVSCLVLIRMPVLCDQAGLFAVEAVNRAVLLGSTASTRRSEGDDGVVPTYGVRIQKPAYLSLTAVVCVGASSRPSRTSTHDGLAVHSFEWNVQNKYYRASLNIVLLPGDHTHPGTAVEAVFSDCEALVIVLDASSVGTCGGLWTDKFSLSAPQDNPTEPLKAWASVLDSHQPNSVVVVGNKVDLCTKDAAAMLHETATNWALDHCAEYVAASSHFPLDGS